MHNMWIIIMGTPVKYVSVKLRIKERYLLEIEEGEQAK